MQCLSRLAILRALFPCRQNIKPSQTTAKCHVQYPRHQNCLGLQRRRCSSYARLSQGTNWNHDKPQQFSFTFDTGLFQSSWRKAILQGQLLIVIQLRILICLLAYIFSNSLVCRQYFNKPFGTRHWLENALGYASTSSSNEHDNHIIILLDPDQIILKPFTADFSQHPEAWRRRTSLPYWDKITHGKPFAQQYGFQWVLLLVLSVP